MLVLILGPMKSAKSAELIARTEPHRVAGKKVTYVKPKMDTRNQGVYSRLGFKVEAVSVESLKDVPESDVYALDEFHMMHPESYQYIKKWLDNGAEVIIASLDTTYDASAFPSIVNLLCLKPDEIILKKAVCEVCKVFNAKYTQILDLEGEAMTSKLPDNLVEDGRFKYEARCRECFVWN